MRDKLALSPTNVVVELVDGNVAVVVACSTCRDVAVVVVEYVATC